MALNIFKKKEKIEKEKPQKKVEKKEEKKEKVSFERKEVPSVSKKQKKGAFSESYRVLKFPHITEKATELTAHNQYVFNVWPRSNKTEVKKSVESTFGVDVVKVRMITIHSKSRKLGKSLGSKKGYKKAIVKIKEGQKIELLAR